MRPLRLNTQGADVAVWQRFLHELKLYDGEIDGRYGPRTAAATGAFQRTQGLADDGIVGIRTYAAALRAGFESDVAAISSSPTPAHDAPSIDEQWTPPPPPANSEWLVSQDPRVTTAHRPGLLPCPENPAPPVGWVYWRGSVPDAIVKLAVDVEFAPARYPMGSFVQARISGQLVGARVEWHDYQGTTGKRGCFRGTSLFRPKQPLD